VGAEFDRWQLRLGGLCIRLAQRAELGGCGGEGSRANEFAAMKIGAL
jgi:hypothetical protein